MVDGKIVLNEQSLEAAANAGAPASEYRRVEEGGNERLVHMATYGKWQKPLRWSKEESELFFKVSSCGVKTIEQSGRTLQTCL